MNSTHEGGPGIAAWFLAMERLAAADAEHNAWLDREIARTRECIYCHGPLGRDSDKCCCRRPDCQRMKRRDAYTAARVAARRRRTA